LTSGNKFDGESFVDEKASYVSLKDANGAIENYALELHVFYLIHEYHQERNLNSLKKVFDLAL
jgi:hypothetical protein